jgi:hypothetical protein
VPTISVFYGIVIRMYVKDHLPPHFHAVYGEFEARFEIISGERMDNPFPRHAGRLVEDWAALHRSELLRNWELIERNELPVGIEGLDADQGH